MTDRDRYYVEKRLAGEAFERYLVDRLVARGVNIRRHEGRLEQLLKGDTTIGIEIKLQERFAEFGSLYFEVAEKRYATDRRWTPSGVYSLSTAPWMLTGSYRQVFLLRRRLLEQESRAHPIKTIARGTSQGFTLTIAEVRDLADRELVFEEMAHDGRLCTPGAAEARATR